MTNPWNGVLTATATPFKKDDLSIDFDKYELFDLSKTAVRSVSYTDQENFYFGVAQEASQEASTSSSVEW